MLPIVITTGLLILGNCIGKRGVEGRRVDLDQEIAGLDRCIVLNGDGLNHAANLRGDIMDMAGDVGVVRRLVEEAVDTVFQHENGADHTKGDQENLFLWTHRGRLFPG